MSSLPARALEAGSTTRAEQHGPEMSDVAAPDTAQIPLRPPRVYLGALALGLLIDYVWPLAILPDRVPVSVQLLAGGLIALAGVALLVAAMRQFKAAGTNVPTVLPTTALVTDGLYAYSRNPIYVALTLIYIGLALAIDSLIVLALVVPVLVTMRYVVIAREEAYLQRKFGEAYRAYRARVRRWL